MTPGSDTELIELLRKDGPLSVSQIASARKVTATAVRQRLDRLIAEGLIRKDRNDANGRGRPSHRYELTEKAQHQVSNNFGGNNFGDLATILWGEIRSVQDPDVRRGLIKRLASSMAAMYAGRVEGETLTERMQSLRKLLAERNVRFEVKKSQAGLPILEAVQCPYPQLAAMDRGICAVEKMVFDELLGGNVRLSQCRFDGRGERLQLAAGTAGAAAGEEVCCRFESN